MQIAIRTLLDDVSPVLRIDVFVGSTGLHVREDEVIVITNRPNDVIPEAIFTTLRHATAHEQGVLPVERAPRLFFNGGRLTRDIRNLLLPRRRLSFRQVPYCI